MTCQSSAAAAKGFNTCVLSRPPTRASVSFFRSKSDRETESTRPLHVLSGSVPQRAGAACTALRRRANRQDNTPLMHRRLALMLLASARALRPIASLRGGARTLRRASAAPSMSDTHCSSVLNSRRPARSSRFRNVSTPSPRQRTHRSRPTQALRLLSDRRRLGRHRLGAPRGHAWGQGRGL